MILGMTACTKENSKNETGFSFTLNGKETAVSVVTTADELKAVMDSLELKYDCYDYEELPYTSVSSYTEDFGLDMTVDFDNNIDSFFIYRGENFRGSFSLLGITEKSTVDDITALFGEYDERFAGDGEYEEFSWENVEAAGITCNLSVAKPLNSEKIETIHVFFSRNIAENQAKG